MSPPWSHSDATLTGGNCQALSDAEKGIYDSSENQSVVSLANEDQKKQMVVITVTPISPPISEGTTPSSSVAALSLPSFPGGQDVKPKPTPPAKQSRWILFQLWFNTYRKFFILVTSINLIGIIMAALGRFKYADNHLGALVLGNLLTAILMRNELFLRFLYLISIYGLRSVGTLYYMKDRR